MYGVSTVFSLLAALPMGVDLDATQDGVVYSPQRAFRIPLDVTKEERAGLSAVRLYVSDDKGATWVRHSDGSPDSEVITFRAKRDGEFWFSIALVDKEKRQTPEDIGAAGAGLKVVVDTTKPTLDLRAIRSKSGRRGVRWSLDEGSVAGSVRLAFFDEKNGQWAPLEVRHPEKGTAWFEGDVAVRKVQASVFDRAGNESVVEVEVDGEQFSKRELSSFVLDEKKPTINVAEKRSVSTGGGPSEVQTVSHVSAAAGVPASPCAICGSHQIVVNYAIDAASPKVNRVELWATRDNGKTWTLAGVDGDGKSPVEATLDEEGVWGLRIVMVDSNLPSPGPTSGTAPETYIDVDTTAPQIRITEAAMVDGQFRVRWTLTERNPTDQPIDVLVSTSPDGPWKPLAQGLKNTGEYTFAPSVDTAVGDFHVRVEAHDRAKHTGSAQTERATSRSSPPAAEPLPRAVPLK